MNLTEVQQLKSLLRLSKPEYRKIDLKIANFCGWTNITDNHPNIGDWVGINPDKKGKLTVVPFFCEDPDNSKMFSDLLLKKYPDLRLKILEESGIYSCYWDFRLKKRGHRISFSCSKLKSAALASSALEVAEFLRDRLLID